MSLFKDYKTKVETQLKEALKINNSLALPRVEKTIISVKLGEAKDNREIVDEASLIILAITGQKPLVCSAKKSISSFKLRQGDPAGLKVTLRGKRMYDFLERFFVLVLPRLRDFRGLPEKSFDGAGNFNIGLTDSTVFPEVDVNKIKKIFGLQITIVTNTKDKEKAKILLASLGLPFAK